ncbi:class I SAM-dependent methyltransferase [Methylacidimicrobium tartarophylax]|uniref:2-polyprenyl-6-hydroxyphenol methylase n=1 Tax=Methylacidimicrobium tartarophylax TaxID=1041768 RepID=A0A5E6MDU2_9BACT|nr:class I SAM-dependent methyltransferase [Methylacidimicrobium tartarophylax]VVM06506.1 hypothetical protein MAMT_01247 [Methylacidimicrobium tartarophylax]
MKDAHSHSVAEANSRSYNQLARERYIQGAPHIGHRKLAELYDRLLSRVFSCAAEHTTSPSVLDLGAGEGSVTRKALAFGARVTAVDVAQARLDQLRQECSKHSAMLETIQSDAMPALESLRSQGKRFDVVMTVAFLHHVPDYLGLLRQAIGILGTHGQILTYEDPLRYDSLPSWSRLVSRVGYLAWRLGQGDILGGATRYLKRRRGIYGREDADNVEYHVVRNGVDQDAIQRLFTEMGLRSELTRYFSTQSPFWQRLGERVGAVNAFSVRGWKP